MQAGSWSRGLPHRCSARRARSARSAFWLRSFEPVRTREEAMTDSIFTDDFQVKPYWWEAAPPEDARDALPEHADVAIVGSGYCGLIAAIELARAGLRTAALDAGPLGFGASTRSGGMVSSGQKLVI